MLPPPSSEVTELLEDQLPAQEHFDALRQTLERLRQELDQLSGTQESLVVPESKKPCVFMSPPPPMTEIQPAIRTVIESVPPKPDAMLERATLEELNMALSLAFSQIAGAGKRTR